MATTDKLGTMQKRTLHVLTGGGNSETMLADGMGDPGFESNLGRVVYAFRQWRGEPAPAWWNEAQLGAWAYRDIAGFCKGEAIEGIGSTASCSRPAAMSAPRSRRATASRSRRSTRGCWRNWNSVSAKESASWPSCASA
jgi:hypothetical protein